MTAAIIEAVDHMGSQPAMAKLLGVHPSFISQLVTGRRKLPYAYCLIVEKATGISKHRLRPDVYGPEPVRSYKRKAG